MAPQVLDLPSKNQINKCGKILKRFAYGRDREMDRAMVAQAANVIDLFREAHSYPMMKVRNGLTSMIRTEAVHGNVSQRLKRVPRIVHKLHRLPNMPLASLEDIGGVRAVLADGPELERLRHRVMRNWGSGLRRDPRNYIDFPKQIGYRAVHFVVERDGRAVEVQLRTRGQQQWAIAVEDADARLGLSLKDGTGPPEMVEYFAVVSEVIFLREYGRSVPGSLRERLDAAARAAVQAGYYVG